MIAFNATKLLKTCEILLFFLVFLVHFQGEVEKYSSFLGMSGEICTFAE